MRLRRFPAVRDFSTEQRRIFRGNGVRSGYRSRRGSTRKAIVAKSKRGQYFVLPDNGLITLVQDRDGVEAAREITNRDLMLGAALSSTFPTAARFFAGWGTSGSRRGLDSGRALAPAVNQLIPTI